MLKRSDSLENQSHLKNGNPIEISADRDKEKRNLRDPLVNLYQIDKESKYVLDKEVQVLLERLLGNIEEFYLLKDLIKNTIQKEERNIVNNVKFFRSLIKEVRDEQFSRGEIKLVS
jgi:hypothetical protein